eukprot:9096878-Alexandrium_andersonii.AAC.1
MEHSAASPDATLRGALGENTPSAWRVSSLGEPQGAHVCAGEGAWREGGGCDSPTTGADEPPQGVAGIGTSAPVPAASGSSESLSFAFALRYSCVASASGSEGLQGQKKEGLGVGQAVRQEER